MTGNADYYQTLGVSRDADGETIKSAFRHLAHRFHPDVSSEPDAEQRFREIAEAYGVLSDPAKRASYDAQGSTGVAHQTAEDLWRDIDFTDIFGSSASTFDGLFGRLFGASTASPRRGEDVRLHLSISLPEVLTGCDHVVTIRRRGPCARCNGRGIVPAGPLHRCPRCGGTGRYVVTGRQGPVLVHQSTTCPQCAGRGSVIDQPCPDCAASGSVTRREEVNIHIPPGMPEGATLRLPSNSTPGSPTDSQAGDIYVTVHTRPDPPFRRDGADLWYPLHIQAPEAALGLTTTVPLLDGQVRVRVPAGTQPDRVLRVAGKGLPRPDGQGRGSLRLKVILDVPRQLSRDQRELYEQLRTIDAGGHVGGLGKPDISQSARPDRTTTAQPPATVPVAAPAQNSASRTRAVFTILAGVLFLIGVVGIVTAPHATLTIFGLAIAAGYACAAYFALGALFLCASVEAKRASPPRGHSPG